MWSRFLKYIAILLLSVPVYAKKNILILGDSLSSGYGISIESGWVALFQEHVSRTKCSYNVVNASIPGDTSSNGLLRLPALLKEHRPSLTIIELGGNDGLRGLDMSIMKKNLQRSIDLALCSNSRVMLIAVRLPDNYGELYLKQFQNVYRELSQHYQSKIIFLSDFFTGLNPKTHLQEDGIHPNALAQPILMHTVWKRVSGGLKC